VLGCHKLVCAIAAPPVTAHAAWDAEIRIFRFKILFVSKKTNYRRRRFSLEATVAVFVLEAEDFVKKPCLNLMYLGADSLLTLV
jgi:hypothetical protein